MPRTNFDNVDDAAPGACAGLGACLRCAFIDWLELLCDGERLHNDWFPMLWPNADSQGQ